MVPDDYANRIGRRMLNVGLGDRPTPDDINDLRRRQDEHAKQTRPKPQKSFYETLADNDRQNAQDNAQHEAPHDAEEGHEDKQGQESVTPKTKVGNDGNMGRRNGPKKDTPLPTFGRRSKIRV